MSGIDPEVRRLIDTVEAWPQQVPSPPAVALRPRPQAQPLQLQSRQLKLSYSPLAPDSRKLSSFASIAPQRPEVWDRSWEVGPGDYGSLTGDWWCLGGRPSPSFSSKVARIQPSRPSPYRPPYSSPYRPPAVHSLSQVSFRSVVVRDQEIHMQRLRLDQMPRRAAAPRWYGTPVWEGGGGVGGAHFDPEAHAAALAAARASQAV